MGGEQVGVRSTAVVRSGSKGEVALSNGLRRLNGTWASVVSSEEAVGVAKVVVDAVGQLIEAAREVLVTMASAASV